MGIQFSDIFGIFQGITTLFNSSLEIAALRIGLIFLGFLLVYLGKKGTLEPLLMIPMGLGMAAVNAGVLVLDYKTGQQGTLFLDPLVTETNALINILQIDFLQPIYTLMFSNGLIACLMFMGIGVLLDVGFVIERPFQSMFIALCAELGTVLTFPVAVWTGLAPGEAAAIAMVGGADGPMVLYTSLVLAKDIFVPITVIAYLYLGLTYGGYPYLIRLLVPERLRRIPQEATRPGSSVSSSQKLAFAVITCTVLCLLLPVAAPLFLSLFIGIAVKESGLSNISNFLESTVLYGATFFLGLLLGVLCEASTILNPKIFLLLALGIFSLLVSGIGGIMGGYIMYFIKGGKFNPAIGIAGVSCVPTCAKVAQKEVFKVAPGVVILPNALGANICGVITSAVLCGIYINLIRLFYP